MKKITIFIISLILVLGLSACSFNINTDPTYQRTISVDGTGIVKISPDIAYVNIGVQSKSGNVKNALDENNLLASTISETLQSLGIASEDIQTSSFNVYPMQDYGPMGIGDETGQPATYYQVDNIILVTVYDLSILGQILDNAVQSGANTINSINFDVTNKEEALTLAREEAIQAAHTQAEATANAAGAKLGDIINISTYTNNATPYFDGKGGAAYGTSTSDVPVSAGQLSISVNANIIYELK
ncbi:MAG: SIMPL domain-containing protein [Anaerolineaceae bacterium]|nr:SIMPL domain-containing protein [Anaerolineaceae bacterium]